MNSANQNFPGEHPSNQSTAASSRRHSHWVIMALIVVMAGLFLLGYLPRLNRNKSLEANAQAMGSAVPVVMVKKVGRAPAQTELVLPGSIESATEAPVLARADGYLSKRYVDIGDAVSSGQLLATIEAPELDQQVAQMRASWEQAKAALAQANAALITQKANQELAEVTAKRWNTLAQRGVVSQQENDQRQSAARAELARTQANEASVKAAEENVRAAKANLDRLEQLRGYKTVRAPFAGVITARNVDIGTLISNGNTLLFRVAQIDRLRIFVNVPQSNQPTVHPGLSAEVTVQQLPGKRFQGKVVRMAGAMDPANRTLLAEIQLPNAGRLLLPGMYAQVSLVGLRGDPPFMVRGDSVVAGAAGTQVALLQPGNIVHFQKISIGRDYGIEVEVQSGLDGGEDVIVNPTDDVREGARVNPLPYQEQNGTAASKGTHAAGTKAK